MNLSGFEDMTAEKTIMDFLKVEASQVFSGHALAKLTIDKYHNEITDALTYRLWTMVPAEHMKAETHEFVVTYPATWWQMFKEQYFSKYLKTHFPIRYAIKKKAIKFDAYVLYPKMPRLFECGEHKQIILTQESEEEDNSK